MKPAVSALWFNAHGFSFCPAVTSFHSCLVLFWPVGNKTEPFVVPSYKP